MAKTQGVPENEDVGYLTKDLTRGIRRSTTLKAVATAIPKGTKPTVQTREKPGHTAHTPPKLPPTIIIAHSVPQNPPTVRIIMRSGTVQAFGSFSGKERDIPFRQLMTA